jgi:hypothetical protein
VQYHVALPGAADRAEARDLPLAGGFRHLFDFFQLLVHDEETPRIFKHRMIRNEKIRVQGTPIASHGEPVSCDFEPSL